MKARRGYSLLEMLVVMAGMSMVLGVCVSLIFTLLRMDRTGRALMAEGNVTARLSRDLRRDVRAAHDVALASHAAAPARQAVLRLTGPRRVEYRVEPSQVIRTLSESGAVQSREVYRLKHTGQTHFELDRAPPSTVVRLVLETGAGAAGSAAQAPWIVESVVGRDGRFEASKE